VARTREAITAAVAVAVAWAQVRHHPMLAALVGKLPLFQMRWQLQMRLGRCLHIFIFLAVVAVHRRVLVIQQQLL